MKSWLTFIRGFSYKSLRNQKVTLSCYDDLTTLLKGVFRDCHGQARPLASPARSQTLPPLALQRPSVVVSIATCQHLNGFAVTPYLPPVQRPAVSHARSGLCISSGIVSESIRTKLRARRTRSGAALGGNEVHLWRPHPPWFSKRGLSGSSRSSTKGTVRGLGNPRDARHTARRAGPPKATGRGRGRAQAEPVVETSHSRGLPELSDAEARLQSLIPATALAPQLPRVVLLGRPNVGKSALFNRLTRRKKALVYNTPDGHVTRDYREGVAQLGDLEFCVLDTAGLEPSAAKGSLEARTRQLTTAALQECCLALLLLDARHGVVAQDRELAQFVREVGVPCLVVANKCENAHRDSGAVAAVLGEAFALGLGEAVSISAETGEGLGELYEKMQPVLEAELAAERPSGGNMEADGDAAGNAQRGRMDLARGPSGTSTVHLAIAGLPNCGKSTLMNRLLGKERCVTGPEPGLTRDAVQESIEVEGRKISLVDTAGWIKRAGREAPEVALSAMDARQRLAFSQVVLLLTDGRQLLDRGALTRVEALLLRHVYAEGRALLVVLNKADLMEEHSPGGTSTGLLRVQKTLEDVLPNLEGVPVMTISAARGDQVDTLLPKVLQVHDRWSIRVSTGRLNRWLLKWSLRQNRPRTEARIRYLTQVKACPPTFVAFVSGAGTLDESRIRHLSSCLREDFGLGGIPLRIIPRKNPDKRDKTNPSHPSNRSSRRRGGG